MNETHGIRLYNILFPIWAFYLFPTPVIFIILTVNFAVDSLVAVLAAGQQKIENRVKLWKKSILKIWIIGFLCDIAGAGLILCLQLLIDWAHLRWNTYLFPGVTLLSFPGVVLAGVLIYILNRRFAFTRCELSPERIRRLSFALAVFTAPYTMLIPLYG